MTSRRGIIETTADEVAAELARRGVRPDERVTVSFEATAAASARPKLFEIAARMRKTATARGLTTEIFDRPLASLERVVPPQGGDDVFEKNPLPLRGQPRSG